MNVRRGVAMAISLLTIAVVATLAVDHSPAGSPGVTRSVTVPKRIEAGPATVWAVGDGADGGSDGRRVGAMIAASEPDRFLYLGDVYETGTREEFGINYEPAFGSLKDVTLPTPGNHEWPEYTQGYEPYWSGLTAKGPPDYYAARVAGWQLISLNSEAPHDPGSAEVQWLRRTVAGGGNCRIAFWHRPRYSAGSHGDQADIAPLWDQLAGRAKLVLNGHDHNMQQLKPIDGITTLIAGSGGAGHYELDPSDDRLAFSNTDSYGALRLDLKPGSAHWQFVAVDGSVLDQGQTNCH